MQSKSASPSRVKRSCKEKTLNFHRENSGLELTNGCSRIRGYLLACFSRGKEYHDWDKHRFHRLTQSNNPLSVRHIERIVGFYRKRCTEFIWLEFRQGRSTRLRVMRADPDNEPETIPEVRRRLVGYIIGTIARNGVAHVDGEFCRMFVRATGLPPELVHLVWAKTRKIAGYRVRWRGVSNGRKMVVVRLLSPTHSRPGPFSTNCVSEEIKPKTTGQAPVGLGSSALRAPVEMDRGSANRLPPYPPQKAAHTDWSAPPAPNTKPLGMKHPPLAVAGRFVSGEKLARLATLLAVTSMRRPHDEFERVKWIFVYPRNFAYRALRDGHEVPEIVAAYRQGVARSHEDSLDADKVIRDDVGVPRLPQRVPSSAVAYAWSVLREDLRTREERWAEIFARGPRVGTPVAKTEVAQEMARRKQRSERDEADTRGCERGKNPAAVSEVAPSDRERAEAAELLPMSKPTREDPQAFRKKSAADLRALLDQARKTAAPQVDGLTQGEFVAWLRDEKQMSIAQFAALPYAVRAAMLGRAREAKRPKHPPDNFHA